MNSPSSMRPALFLDRDGVINIDFGYVHHSSNFVFTEGIFDLVRFANASGLLVIVVTNQAGIARGLYGESEFHDLCDWMRTQFLLAGAALDAVYFCPHHPEEGVGPLKLVCDCRKPKPGMFMQAIQDFYIEPSRSIVIGDKASDLLAGYGAGIPNLFLFQPTIAFGSSTGPPPSTSKISDLMDPQLTALIERLRVRTERSPS